MAGGRVRETRDDEDLSPADGWRAWFLSVGRSILMAALIPIGLLLMKAILGSIFYWISRPNPPG